MKNNSQNKSKLLEFVLFCCLVLMAFVCFNYGFKTTYSITEPDNLVLGEYGTYENAVKIVQELMKSYYIREQNTQYNYAKVKYGNQTPEEATSQDILYTVCAAYNYDVYTVAFGVNYSYDGFPRYNYEVMEEAQKYYSNQNNAFDGKYLIYYEKKASSIKYVFNDSDNISDFASIIQPGDVFVYTGHVMMAYDKVQKADGTWDVLMLQSSGRSSIRTRINGTSKLYYNKKPITEDKQNGVLDVNFEGNINYFWLSSSSKFVKSGKLSCGTTECAVIRPYYNDNGKAVFNYKINPDNYEKSLLRLQYPGMIIEKTVDKGDNNSVYPNDELTYTIKITNKSTAEYKNINYGNFSIVEHIGDYVSYIGSTSNGNFSDGDITWNISGLNAGNSIELKYTVRVKNNIDEQIAATGYFYNGSDSNVNISTGLVKNKIIPRVTSKNQEYSSCYNAGINAQKSGLELISYIYNCARENDFSFSEFAFENVFNKKETIPSKATSNAITLKDSDDEVVNTFQKMILNNYWSGLVKLEGDDGDDSKYVLPRWSGSDTRNRTINPSDFKDGDILIYSVDYSETISNLIHTEESGIYAFIYINGKFIGNNYSGTERERNTFDYEYYNNHSLDIYTHLYAEVDSISANEYDDILEYVNYQTLFDKDYYVILRPELAIEETNMDIDAGTNIDDFNLNLSDDYTVVILDRNNNVKTTGYIGTGYVIKVYYENKLVNEYIAIVKGDVTGDGSIAINDVAKLYRGLKKKITLENYEIESGDVLGDDEIKINDVAKLYRYIKGKINAL